MQNKTEQVLYENFRAALTKTGEQPSLTLIVEDSLQRLVSTDQQEHRAGREVLRYLWRDCGAQGLHFLIAESATARKIIKDHHVSRRETGFSLPSLER